MASDNVKKKDIKGFSDNLEFIADSVAHNMFKRAMAVRKTMGVRPYRGIPVAKDEQMRRYLQVRRDSTALGQILGENTRVKDDGTLLLPKELVKRLGEMEGELRKGGL